MADRDKRASVPGRLQEAGGLTGEVARRVSRDTGVPEADVYGTGSFYHLLSRPDIKVRICQGPACRLAGSEGLLERAKGTGLPAEACACLAACDRPVAGLRERRVLPDLKMADLDRAAGDWKELRSSAQDGEEDWRGGIGPEGADPGSVAIHLRESQDFTGAALARARKLGADRVIDQIDRSGLQGRGGAGFPAAIKWKGVRAQQETVRYVVLNADEGEPGTFKDREVLTRRPDRVLEGLAIAAVAVGAKDVYLYIRGEFGIPWRSVKAALERYGENDSFAGIRFHFHAGHGAYICGEETALFEALEGKRGMPRLRPPFPTEKGLWGMPTLIHNVETIACVPSIVERGGDWFRDLGRTGPGTKLFSVSGHVRRPGVYELPLGVTLDDLAEAAGGYRGRLKAFLPGGASGGFLPAAERKRPLDYRSLAEVGSMLGSAGVTVLNDTVGIAAEVRALLAFFEEESCGQCAPCRIGTRFQRESVDRFLAGCGNGGGGGGALRLVEPVAWEMNEGSICGLGQAASLPLTSAMRWFPEEFEQ